VAKTPISELIKALNVLKSLQETVGKHEQVIEKILDRLDAFDERLTEFEKARKR
jgi:uncharacterized coiled-coil protein SlyX